MPAYKIGDQRVRRKNLYLPCVIADSLDGKSDEEVAAIYKATRWADNITNAEWPVVLGEADCSPSAKSRLKKKGAGWLMALGRIAVLNPELHAAIVKQAEEMYEEQVGEEHPSKWQRETVEAVIAHIAQKGEATNGN